MIIFVLLALIQLGQIYLCLPIFLLNTSMGISNTLRTVCQEETIPMHYYSALKVLRLRKQQMSNKAHKIN